VPDTSGTLLAVKERPKVARRPTIVAAIVAPKKQQHPKSARPTEVALATAANAAQPHRQPSAQNSEKQTSRLRPTAVASTIPEKKPLVQRKSKIIAAATSPVKKQSKPEAKAGLTAHASSEEASVKAQVKPAAKPKGIPETKSGSASSKGWTSWLPLAVGIALGSVSPQLYALAAHWEPWGLRVLFPYVQLTGLHDIGLSDELTHMLPQLMLYLQFPLEGLLVACTIRRGVRLSAAVGPVPSLHFVGGLVLWIVALGSLPRV
jgi:hypothetical protein